MITKLLQNAEKVFKRQPQLFERALKLLYSLWGSAHNRRIISVLRALPKFWHSVCTPMLSVVEPVPRKTFESCFAPTNSTMQTEEEPARAGEPEKVWDGEKIVAQCYQLACQEWSLRIVALELYHVTAAGMDKELEDVLRSIGSKTGWETWIKPFVQSSFEPSLMVDLNAVAAHLGVDLFRFQTMRTPSHRYGQGYMFDTPLLAKKFAARLDGDPAVSEMFDLLPLANLAFSLADAQTSVVQSVAQFLEVLVFRHPWLFSGSPRPEAKGKGAAAASSALRSSTKSPKEKMSFFGVLKHLAFVAASETVSNEVVESMLYEALSLFLTLVGECTFPTAAKTAAALALFTQVMRPPKNLTEDEAAELVELLLKVLERTLTVYRTTRSGNVPILLPPVVTSILLLLRYVQKLSAGAERSAAHQERSQSPILSPRAGSAPSLGGPSLSKHQDMLLPLLCEAIAFFSGNTEVMKVCVACLDALLSQMVRVSTCVRSMTPFGTLPTLIRTLALEFRDQTSPALAEVIIDLFLSLSDDAEGAAVLVHEGLLRHISSRTLFGSDFVGVIPHEDDGSRSGWHSVWCHTLALVGTLLCALPYEESVVESVLEFVSLHEHALAAALVLGTNPLQVLEDRDPNAPGSLTLARLEEMERVTGLLHVLSSPQFVSRWHFAIPQAADAHQAAIVGLFEAAVEILHNPVTLGTLAIPVTKGDFKLTNLGLSGSENKPSRTASHGLDAMYDMAATLRLMREQKFNVGGKLGKGKQPFIGADGQVNFSALSARQRRGGESALESSKTSDASSELSTTSSSSSRDGAENAFLAKVSRGLLNVVRSTIGLAARLSPDVHGLLSGEVLYSSSRIMFIPLQGGPDAAPPLASLVVAISMAFERLKEVDAQMAGDDASIRQIVLSETRSLLFFVIENCTYVFLGHALYFLEAERTQAPEVLDYLKRDLGDVQEVLGSVIDHIGARDGGLAEENSVFFKFGVMLASRMWEGVRRRTRH